MDDGISKILEDIKNTTPNFNQIAVVYSYLTVPQKKNIDPTIYVNILLMLPILDLKTVIKTGYANQSEYKWLNKDQQVQIQQFINGQQTTIDLVEIYNQTPLEIINKMEINPLSIFGTYSVTDKVLYENGKPIPPTEFIELVSTVLKYDYNKKITGSIYGEYIPNNIIKTFGTVTKYKNLKYLNPQNLFSDINSDLKNAFYYASTVPYNEYNFYNTINSVDDKLLGSFDSFILSGIYYYLTPEKFRKIPLSKLFELIYLEYMPGININSLIQQEYDNIENIDFYPWLMGNDKIKEIIEGKGIANLPNMQKYALITLTPNRYIPKFGINPLSIYPNFNLKLNKGNIFIDNLYLFPNVFLEIISEVFPHLTEIEKFVRSYCAKLPNEAIQQMVDKQLVSDNFQYLTENQLESIDQSHYEKIFKNINLNALSDNINNPNIIKLISQRLYKDVSFDAPTTKTEHDTTKTLTGNNTKISIPPPFDKIPINIAPTLRPVEKIIEPPVIITTQKQIVNLLPPAKLIDSTEIKDLPSAQSNIPRNTHTCKWNVILKNTPVGKSHYSRYLKSDAGNKPFDNDGNKAIYKIIDSFKQYYIDTQGLTLGDTLSIDLPLSLFDIEYTLTRRLLTKDPNRPNNRMPYTTDEHISVGTSGVTFNNGKCCNLLNTIKWTFSDFNPLKYQGQNVILAQYYQNGQHGRCQLWGSYKDRYATAKERQINELDNITANMPIINDADFDFILWYNLGNVANYCQTAYRYDAEWNWVAYNIYHRWQDEFAGNTSLMVGIKVKSSNYLNQSINQTATILPEHVRLQSPYYLHTFSIYTGYDIKRPNDIPTPGDDDKIIKPDETFADYYSFKSRLTWIPNGTVKRLKTSVLEYNVEKYIDQIPNYKASPDNRNTIYNDIINKKLIDRGWSFFGVSINEPRICCRDLTQGCSPGKFYITQGPYETTTMYPVRAFPHKPGAPNDNKFHTINDKLLLYCIVCNKFFISMLLYNNNLSFIVDNKQFVEYNDINVLYNIPDGKEIIPDTNETLYMNNNIEYQIIDNTKNGICLVDNKPVDPKLVISSHNSKTIDECKNICTSNQLCTSFNYNNITSSCDLLNVQQTISGSDGNPAITCYKAGNNQYTLVYTRMNKPIDVIKDAVSHRNSTRVKLYYNKTQKKYGVLKIDPSDNIFPETTSNNSVYEYEYEEYSNIDYFYTFRSNNLLNGYRIKKRYNKYIVPVYNKDKTNKCVFVYDSTQKKASSHALLYNIETQTLYRSLMPTDTCKPSGDDRAILFNDFYQLIYANKYIIPFANIVNDFMVEYNNNNLKFLYSKINETQIKIKKIIPNKLQFTEHFLVYDNETSKFYKTEGSDINNINLLTDLEILSIYKIPPGTTEIITEPDLPNILCKNTTGDVFYKNGDIVLIPFNNNTTLSQQLNPVKYINNDFVLSSDSNIKLAKDQYLQFIFGVPEGFTLFENYVKRKDFSIPNRKIFVRNIDIYNTVEQQFYLYNINGDVIYINSPDGLIKNGLIFNSVDGRFYKSKINFNEQPFNALERGYEKMDYDPNNLLFNVS